MQPRLHNLLQCLAPGTLKVTVMLVGAGAGAALRLSLRAAEEVQGQPHGCPVFAVLLFPQAQRYLCGRKSPCSYLETKGQCGLEQG